MACPDPHRRRSPLAAGLFLLVSPVLAAETGHGVDAATGLESWHWAEAGIQLTLVQRLPDQTRAFFEARGLDAAHADALARNCVFQTVIRNTGQRSFRFDLGEWRVVGPGGRRPLRLRADWLAHWQDRGLSGPARIALRWALYPRRQRFAPGDYNWGMTAMGLPPGSRFDLHFVWYRGQSRLSGVLHGLRCAPEQLRAPAAAGGEGGA